MEVYQSGPELPSNLFAFLFFTGAAGSSCQAQGDCSIVPPVLLHIWPVVNHDRNGGGLYLHLSLLCTSGKLSIHFLYYILSPAVNGVTHPEVNVTC